MKQRRQKKKRDKKKTGTRENQVKVFAHSGRLWRFVVIFLSLLFISFVFLSLFGRSQLLLSVYILRGVQHTNRTSTTECHTKKYKKKVYIKKHAEQKERTHRDRSLARK